MSEDLVDVALEAVPGGFDKYQTGSRLADKVAIVVGGGSISSGIGNGRATSILFGRAGAHVAILDRDRAAAEATRRVISKEGGSASPFQVDATDADSCRHAVEEVEQLWGKIDILVNVVGSNSPLGSVLGVDTPDWDDGMHINVTSVFLMCKYVIPVMVRNGGGSIVSISSIGGIIAHRGTVNYAAAKAGVIGMTRAIAFDHGSDGIRANCIAPGLVDTPMARAQLAAGPVDKNLLERRRQRSMLKTLGTGWDIGCAALFLASDESRWITAQTLVVDAGATAMFEF